MHENRPNRAAAALLAGASLASALASVGCDLGGTFKKKPSARIFVPPTPVIRTMPEVREPTFEDPPEIEATFTVEGEPELFALSIPKLPEPPAPPPPAVSKPKAPAPAAVVETTPAPATPERPKLAPILNQAETNAYNRELDQKLERIRGVLALAAGKNLTGSQRETVAQIRSLQTLAEQARRQDLVTAVDYARRADLLANDLAGRLP